MNIKKHLVTLEISLTGTEVQSLKVRSFSELSKELLLIEGVVKLKSMTTRFSTGDTVILLEIKGEFDNSKTISQIKKTLKELGKKLKNQINPILLS
jgi:hypothetical protein